MFLESDFVTQFAKQKRKYGKHLVATKPTQRFHTSSCRTHFKSYYQIIFSPIFTNWNKFCDFLFDFLDDLVHFSRASAVKGKNCLVGSKFFPVRVDSI